MEEVDAKERSQHLINMIWEYTQAAIAVGVVAANIALAFLPTIQARDLMANAFFLVIGFYFGRTNHARLGDKTK